MVIDTSAIVAVLCNEPERRQFAEAIEADETRLVSAAAAAMAIRSCSGVIEADETRLVSAATLVEATMVIERRYGSAGGKQLEKLISTASLQIAALTADQAQVACEAFRRFGRGRHPARLNFGDVFAYALAKVTGEPLLFKGEDFVQTDIVPVQSGNR